MSKKIKVALAFLALSIIALTIYAKSFPDVERICPKKESEIYLLHYVTKGNLEQTVRDHNSKFPPQKSETQRVYLLRPIFRIPDPIFESVIDYKKNNCEQIDNMDIFAEVRYSKNKKGQTEVWYNFLE